MVVQKLFLSLSCSNKLKKQTVMQNNTQVQEILVAHGLDFRIEKEQYVRNDKPTGYYGLFNSKTQECINVVKEGYTVSQNDEVVEVVLEGMRPFGNDLRVSKAGSIHGGRKVYLQLEIEGDGHINGDRIKRYVTVIDSNDGSTSLSIGIGDLTMSCQNQFWKFYKAGESKFRHTATIAERIKEIPMLIETALNASLKQMNLYQNFASTDITKSLAHKMVKHLLGYDREYTSMSELSKKSTRSINIMDKLYANIEREIADKGMNLWGLHSGVTRYTTHEQSAPKRDNGRIESGMLGTGYKMNEKSLDFVMKESGILIPA